MGILTPEGRYISLRNNVVNVEQSRTINTFSDVTTINIGVYNVMADYEIYASKKASDDGKKALEKKFINCVTPTDKISGLNVHTIVYNKIKELYPGSIDL